MVEPLGSVAPAPKPEGMDRALWVTCALCRALNSHTQESCCSCSHAHTLLSGLSLVWGSTWELQSWFLFAGNEIHFPASLSQPLLSWTSSMAQTFHSWQDPLVPREQTAGGPHAHPETGVLQVTLQEATPNFPTLETALMAYSSEHNCCAALSNFITRCVIFSN